MSFFKFPKRVLIVYQAKTQIGNKDYTIGTFNVETYNFIQRDLSKQLNTNVIILNVIPLDD